MYHCQTKNRKNFWKGGTAHLSPHCGGDTPSPDPIPSAPSAPWFSRFRRSAFPFLFIYDSNTVFIWTYVNNNQRVSTLSKYPVSVCSELFNQSISFVSGNEAHRKKEKKREKSDRNASDHVSNLLESCRPLLYAFRVLHTHGLLPPPVSLQDVFRSTIFAKIRYCSLAWSGYCSAANRVRLDGSVKRCKRRGGTASNRWDLRWWPHW